MVACTILHTKFEFLPILVQSACVNGAFALRLCVLPEAISKEMPDITQIESQRHSRRSLARFMQVLTSLTRIGFVEAFCLQAGGRHRDIISDALSDHRR